jgi:hypothetical protein
MRKIVAITLLAAMAAAGCKSTVSGAPPPAGQSGGSLAGSVPSPASSPFATSPAPATPAITVVAAPPSRWASRPPRHVTPGAAGRALAVICPTVSAALEARRPGTSVKNAVYAEYGIPASLRYRYRIDHLVPLELDGRNSIGNLWPQLIGPSRAKDRLENTLHSMVCAGEITLANAQRAIRTNWVRAYHTYVSTVPVPSAAPAPSPPPSPAPSPAGCYPKTASGNCYEPGEFCSTADHGMTGVAGDGEAIACEDNNGWRWEPA